MTLKPYTYNDYAARLYTCFVCKKQGGRTGNYLADRPSSSAWHARLCEIEQFYVSPSHITALCPECFFKQPRRAESLLMGCPAHDHDFVTGEG